MGFIFSLIKKLVKLILYAAIFFTIIVLVPNLPPYTSFSTIEREPLLPRIGNLAPNEALNNAQKLYDGKLLGPEAFQEKDGEIYTGLATGEIVKLSSGGHVTFVTQLGKPCTGLVQEHICGRPLGFQIDKKKNLIYVADAYHGIWKVDLKTNKKQLLVSPQVEIAGRKPKLFNSVEIDNNGNLYWTDSTSDFHLKDGVFALFANPSGRLLHFNKAKNEYKVLLDNLWFANGLAMSPENNFLIVAETMKRKLWKYYINGPKKGTSEIFIAGLPGMPDNLRALPDGSGLLVALYQVFDDNNPNILDSLGQTPMIRKFLTRLMRLIEIPFEFLNSYFPHIIFEEITYNVGNFKSLSLFSSKITGFIQVDWNGNIVASYYNTDENLIAVSDVIVHNDMLYMGSPHVQNYVGAVPAPPLLKKAFSKTSETGKPTGNKQAPPKPAETKQAPSKPTETKQAPPKPTETKQAPPKTVETKQTPPKPAETKQAPPKTVETKQTPPKPVVTKQTPPKPAETKQAPPKPVETKQTPPKPAETKQAPPKPVETKQTPHKPVETKQAPHKPTQTKQALPKPTENKQALPKPVQTKQAPPKPAENKQPPPKPVGTKQVPPKPVETKQVPPKPVETKQAPPPTEKKQTAPPKENLLKSDKKSEKARVTESDKASSKPASRKPVPDQIPIKEEIPSDTIKPNRETLKVIKKEGPTEIPNPSL